MFVNGIGQLAVIVEHEPAPLPSLETINAINTHNLIISH